MIRSLFCILFSVIFILSCTQPPNLLNTEISVFLHDQIKFSELPKKIRGGGDISLSINGERYYGYADVIWESSGKFRADFYSPFGGVIASARADSLEGIVSIKENQYKFKIDEIMDSLPYSWGKSLTFKEFILLLTGQVSLFSEKLKEEPDSIVSKKRYSKLFWETNSSMIIAEVNRKSSRIEKIQLQTQLWCMQFHSIKEKLARFIEFREDDNNYFSIKYEQLNSE
ncbi:MAG: hypothetical protein GXY77_12060 [Fibrobacter sp.]|nr:hypothetical protein [Fibrobacter sp.]